MRRAGQGRGLQAKMTTSYVLVTAAAVLLVEAVLLAVALPALLRSTQSGQDPSVAITASKYATLAQQTAGKHGGRLPTRAELPLGDPEIALGPGQARVDPGDSGAEIPYTRRPYGGPSEQPTSLALLLDTDGTVVATSFPSQYPVGSHPDGLPYRPMDPAKGSGGGATVPGGKVRWAALPVTVMAVVPTGSADAAPPGPTVTPAGAARTGKQGPHPIGSVYVQVPGGAAATTTHASVSEVSPLLRAGLIVLALTIPVGVVFGLLSTRRLVRRLRRLADVTGRIAEGDFRPRLPVAGDDEVARLEHSVNVMAERLDVAMATERRLATANARHAERSRIAPELHDSISQDLFSLRLLAGGLSRALPAGSPLGPEVMALEQTADGTALEMQALLLELRPIALDEVGLVAALADVSRSYEARLGVRISTELAAVNAPPEVEHALLRVAQEAIANAVRHGAPDQVTLRLYPDGAAAVVEVVDDGRGFDPADRTAGTGSGLT